MALPDATPQNPACGVCRGETRPEGEQFVCEDCGLAFDDMTMEAEFLDPDAEVCGAPCDNTWHGDHKIRPGKGFQCGTCQLPAGHPSTFHWTVSLDVEWAAQDAAWNVYADIPTVTLTAAEVMDRAEPGDDHPWWNELRVLWMHDRQTVLDVLDSVAAEGFRSPIIIGPDGRLWDGHHRLAVALALGIPVPVRRIPEGHPHA